jgi:hypothetical protein
MNGVCRSMSLDCGGTGGLISASVNGAPSSPWCLRQPSFTVPRAARLSSSTTSPMLPTETAPFPRSDAMYTVFVHLNAEKATLYRAILSAFVAESNRLAKNGEAFGGWLATWRYLWMPILWKTSTEGLNASKRPLFNLRCDASPSRRTPRPTNGRCRSRQNTSQLVELLVRFLGNVALLSMRAGSANISMLPSWAGYAQQAERTCVHRRC